MESIKTVTGTELKENDVQLLNHMKKLRHTAKDILGSTPIRELGLGCYNLTINVGGDEYPVYYNANTTFADGVPEITDDIFDEDNHLGIIDDDTMFWFALAMQLDMVIQSKDRTIDSGNEEIMRLQNEIEGLNEALREANKKCTEYVHRIDELEVDNKRLSERVKTLVIEKTNRAAIAEKVSDPKEDIETKNFDMETLQLLNKITELEEENDRLKVRIDDMEADELLGDSCDVGKAIDNENTEELIEENKILRERISELAVRNTEVEKLLEKSGVTRDDKKSLIKDMKRVISAIMTYDED